ncbi:PQQ-binding-like beta-propeller repeat protein [Nonomuraea sp. NPDC049421]|uniref:outer membrane protein assembly factor BamB family protein n=1 Tax=Nonomuraea sp. NPDC049421 TaxID=3155275 RepID=UPI003415281D
MRRAPSMLIGRWLRALAALVVTAALAVAADGRPPRDLIGWKEAWSVPAGSMAALNALVGDHLLMAARDGSVTVREAGTGAVLRTIATGVTSPTEISADAGIVFLTSSTEGVTKWVVHAHDLTSGRFLWRHTVPTSGGRGLPQVQAVGPLVVLHQNGHGLVSLDARTGAVRTRTGDPPGCHGWTAGASRSVMLLTRCERGGVQLASYDPRTLRGNWTRTLPATPDADTLFVFEPAPEGFVAVKVQDERFLFDEDGTRLPLSHWPGDDLPFWVGAHPDAHFRPGFDFNGAWPLPGFLLSRERGTGRLVGFPLDRPLAHATTFVGATSRFAFVHDDERVTAFRPVYGRPEGPVALGGVPLRDWPDACSLLTSKDLGEDVRRVPATKSLGRLSLPAACDYVPDDGDVISLAVSWVSQDAGAVFAATTGQVKGRESFDYDPTSEAEGIFSYTFHGAGGTGSATLVNVGPVIVHLTSQSRLLQRLAAGRVRDNLMARYRPGARVPPRERTGGWTHLAEAGVRADPVVDGDVVYAGADDGLYALDAVTGRFIWRSVPATPELVDGVLYGVGNGVAAIDPATGRTRWLREFDARNVVIQDGGVYAGAGFSHVLALDAAGGKRRWRVRVPGSLGDVAVTAGTVYATSRKGPNGDERGVLSAYDAATGALRWRSSTGTADAVPTGHLIAAGKTVFAVSDGRLTAFDAATGRARWRRESGHIALKPVVIGDTVYVGHYGGLTYALDAATGKERWRLTPEATAGSWSVTESRGTLYVGGQKLHALDPSTGRERWSRPITATASVHGDTVFAQDDNGTLHALDAATGASRWSFQTGSHFQTRPAVAHGLVYVGGSNGNLYALRAKDGVPGSYVAGP